MVDPNQTKPKVTPYLIFLLFYSYFDFAISL